MHGPFVDSVCTPSSMTLLGVVRLSILCCWSDAVEEKHRIDPSFFLRLSSSSYGFYFYDCEEENRKSIIGKKIYLDRNSKTMFWLLVLKIVLYNKNDERQRPLFSTPFRPSPLCHTKENSISFPIPFSIFFPFELT